MVTTLWAGPGWHASPYLKAQRVQSGKCSHSWGHSALCLMSLQDWGFWGDEANPMDPTLAGERGAPVAPMPWKPPGGYQDPSAG
eukprot:4998301-Amphidinium_carterae.1